MIGWAVWYSTFKDLDKSPAVAAGTDFVKIGYSQALVIAAWTSSIALGAAGAALAKDAA
jgi:hypothetical protein